MSKSQLLGLLGKTNTNQAKVTASDQKPSHHELINTLELVKNLTKGEAFHLIQFYHEQIEVCKQSNEVTLCVLGTGTHKVECMDPTQNDRRSVTEAIQYPFGLTAYGKNLYYTDWTR